MVPYFSELTSCLDNRIEMWGISSSVIGESHTMMSSAFMSISLARNSLGKQPENVSQNKNNQVLNNQEPSPIFGPILSRFLEQNKKCDEEKTPLGAKGSILLSVEETNQDKAVDNRVDVSTF